MTLIEVRFTKHSNGQQIVAYVDASGVTTITIDALESLLLEIGFLRDEPEPTVSEEANNA